MVLEYSDKGLQNTEEAEGCEERRGIKQFLPTIYTFT